MDKGNNANYKIDLDNQMRILANLLIDRLLEDAKNNRLQYLLKATNLNLGQNNNHGN